MSSGQKKILLVESKIYEQNDDNGRFWQITLSEEKLEDSLFKLSIVDSLGLTPEKKQFFATKEGAVEKYFLSTVEMLRKCRSWAVPHETIPVMKADFYLGRDNKIFRKIIVEKFSGLKNCYIVMSRFCLHDRRRANWTDAEICDSLIEVILGHSGMVREILL